MACDTCHRRKVRCDYKERVPCSACRHANISCSFHLSQHFRKRRRKPQSRPPSDRPSPPREATRDLNEENPSPSIQFAYAEEEHAVGQSGSVAASTPRVRRFSEDEQLARWALPTFYQSTTEATSPAPRSSRWAYVGSSASNLAHLVNARTRRPDRLHYPFPLYRSPLPWKPSASCVTARAIPMIQPEGASKAHEPPLWTYTTAPDPDLGVLPVNEVRKDLIDAYFEHIHPGFPVIQEVDFRRRLHADRNDDGDGNDSLRQEPPALLVLQCVLLGGSHVSDHPAVRDNRAQVKDALYRRAKGLFEMRYENDRVSLLQAALILTWHVESADDITANAWHWSGIASRIALGLGMHRRYTCANMDEKVQRRMRSLWWVVVQTEVLCALHHGRPVSFDPDDCDQETLCEKDLAEDELIRDADESTPVCTANVDFCLSNASLCTIIWDMLKLLSPGSMRRLGGEDSAAAQEARTKMNGRLAGWCIQLPVSMAHPSRPAPSSMAAQLHLHYYTAVLSLNRILTAAHTEPRDGLGSAPGSFPSAFPHRSYTKICNDPQSQSWLLCHTSAVCILSTLNRIVEMNWTKRCWLSTLTSVLAAAIQFSSEVGSANPPETSSTGDLNAADSSTHSPHGSPSRPNSCGLASVVLDLASLDRLQALSSISVALTPHWSSAEGLNILVENMLEELRVAMAENFQSDSGLI